MTGGPAAHPAIRRATAGDIPAIRAILRAHGEDGPVAPGDVDIVGPYLGHLAEHHLVLLVEEGSTVVAFGSVLDTGRCRMLSDLFVLPDRLGRGVGRPLLAALLGGAPARVTLASADPRALPIYVRAGMTPLWPNLYLEGPASRLAGPSPSIRVRDAGPAETAALERAWTGDDRPADHAFWASQAGADPFVVEDAGEPVALGFGRAKQASATRALDRLVVRPGSHPVAPAIAALVRAARGGRVQACMLGPNPLLPVLLDAGFHVVDRDQLLASDPALVDPARLLPNPGML